LDSTNPVLILLPSSCRRENDDGIFAFVVFDTRREEDRLNQELASCFEVEEGNREKRIKLGRWLSKTS
jgi:hypothetical protein